MADSEKITINLNPVDLGQIDLLVEEGFYSNRTDFIRTAIRSQLQVHGDAVKQSMQRNTLAIGVVRYDRAELEQVREARQVLSIRVVGMLVLARDIPVELARETIGGIKVYGAFHVGEEVREALADRIAMHGVSVSR